jgi:hypothetical protein
MSRIPPNPDHFFLGRPISSPGVPYALRLTCTDPGKAYAPDAGDVVFSAANRQTKTRIDDDMSVETATMTQLSSLNHPRQQS